LDWQRGSIKGITPPKTILLNNTEVLSLRPSDRDNYAEKIIKELLAANPKGLTISEIDDITGLNRNTITKHLKRLVAIREVLVQKRGNLSIFYRIGEIMSSANILDSIARNISYAFHSIKNDDGDYVYIQEIREDYYGSKKVSGGIMVKNEDLFNFISSLQSFALEVTE
jgi:predicted HTH transcriptional regulator